MDTIIILAATAARTAQGNGYAGPGRWAMLPIMLLAAWLGPLDGINLFGVETATVMMMALGGWACVATGRTDWGNWRYGLFLRYMVPIWPPTWLAFGLTGREELLLYLLVTPALTAMYYFIAQHGQPEWYTRLARGTDMTAPLAGATVASLVLL